jgi:oligosaccharide repeat unit polymerase
MTKDINYGYYTLLFNSGPLCVLLFGVATFKKFNDVRWVRHVAFVMVFVTIAVNLMTYPNRTTLFFNVGFFLIFVNYLYKRISPIVIAALLVVAIAVFVSIGSLRDQYGGGSAEGKAMDVVLELPYKYLANNYWNLDYALNPPNDREIHPHTYGIDFFNGIFEYAKLTGSFRNSFHWDDSFNNKIQKVEGFNTVNYLWEVYKDFHLFGVFLFPLLCGIGLTVLHLRLCRPFTPRQILMYTYFIYFVGWWFFTAGYKQGIFCIWGAVIYFVSTVCMWQTRGTEKELPAEPAVSDKVSDQEQAQA